MQAAPPKDMRTRTRRFQQMLDQSRMPQILCAEKETSDSPAEIIHKRATLYVAQFKQSPQEDMVHLIASSLDNVIHKTQALDLKELLDSKCKGPMNHMSCFMDLRRLMPLATPKALRVAQPDLNSVAAVDALLKYVTRTKTLWKSARMVAQPTLTDLVNSLIEEADTNEQVLLDNSKSASWSGSMAANGSSRGSAPSMEAKHLMLEAMNSVEYTWIEGRLEAHAAGRPLPHGGDDKLKKEDARLQAFSNLPKWYHPIKDILECKSGLMKRALFGDLKLPPKGRATQVSELKKKLESFMHLRLVWDEKAKLSDSLLEFRAKASFISNLKSSNLSKLHNTVLEEVQEEFRTQVKNAADRRHHGPRALIEDRHKAREKYKLLMDRALLCRGYENVERLGALPLSHGAAVDTFEAFVEAGDPLGGAMLEAHEAMALEYLRDTLAEAERKLHDFQQSEDPGASHPQHIIDKQGVAYLKMQRRHKNTGNLMNLREYPGVRDMMQGNLSEQPKWHNKDRAPIEPGGHQHDSWRPPHLHHHDRLLAGDRERDRARQLEPKRARQLDGKRARQPDGGKPSQPNSSQTAPRHVQDSTSDLHCAGPEKKEPDSRHSPKRQKIEPWDVEIGALTKSVDGNPPRVVVKETATTIQAGEKGPTLNKADLAMLCDCGPDDKCWAVALSMQKWPFKLKLCNHSGEAGHEHYDSDLHVFSKRELFDIDQLAKSTLASQKLATGE